MCRATRAAAEFGAIGVSFARGSNDGRQFRRQMVPNVPRGVFD